MTFLTLNKATRHDCGERTWWDVVYGSWPGTTTPPLLAAYRKPARPEGTITHVNGLIGEAAVSVQIDRQVGTSTFKVGDVEVLP